MCRDRGAGKKGRVIVTRRESEFLGSVVGFRMLLF